MCNGISGISVDSAGARGLPRRGELINKLCHALTEPDERRQFYLNEDAFCLRFGLDKSARQAIRDRDYLRLIDLGGHVAQLDKLAALSGLNTLQAIRMRRGASASTLLTDVSRKDS